MSLQFVLGINTMQSSTLTHAIAWMHCSAAMFPFSLRWKINYHSQILKKLKGLSLTPIDSRERSPYLSKNQEWNGRERETAKNHTIKWGGKEGAMKVV